MNLISDILDLSKIESGTVSVDAEEIYFTNLLETVARPFRHEAERRHLSFNVDLDPHLTRSIVTDSKRLQQVLKNLLSNAFKFTEHGGVRLRISGAAGGWNVDHPILGKTPSVVAFEVTDTGIGISSEKQKIIFEAFQQADASTSRKYGGTGLGLAISRELAHLLGGEIQLRSTPGKGSTFTLYLPLKYAGPPSSQIAQGASAMPAPQPAAYRLPDRPIEPLPDDRDDLRAGECYAADRRGRRPLCARAHRSCARQRLQGAGGCHRRGRARARQRLSPDGRIARRVPARTCWVGPF